MDNIYINFLNGGIAGIISRTVTSPFEILKVLKQNYPHKYNDRLMISSMRVIYNRNGLNGYFNGNLTNCIRIFPQSAIQWSTFNYSRSHLENVIKNTTFTNFISGGIAGMVSYGIIYPLETIRSKLSVQNKDTKLYNGIVDCFTKSIRVNGFRSLYNGCGLSLLGCFFIQ